MKLFLLMTQIILFFKLFQVKCDLNLLRKNKTYEKFFLNDLKSIHHLQVSTEHYEPFMYRDENGHFHNGIEYKLFKTIAEKEQLDLSFNFVNRLRMVNLEKFIFGYVFDFQAFEESFQLFFIWQFFKVIFSHLLSVTHLSKRIISWVVLTFWLVVCSQM